MRDRVADSAPLHYLASLGPPSRAAWERGTASITVAEAKRARLSLPGDDLDEECMATLKTDMDDKGNSNSEVTEDDEDLFGVRSDMWMDSSTTSGLTAKLRGRSPGRSPGSMGSPRPPPFVAASIATEAAVQATCALSRPVEVLARAGRLLAKPPMNTTFSDEEDMRRVLSLVYDVFRYKAVLAQVLSETGFLTDNMRFREQEPCVWLLLLDLIGRRFTGRVHTPSGDALMESAGLAEADAALWQRRVPLAAAVARARVRCGALRMSQLLPPRLRDENMQRAASRPICGWLNPFVLKNNEDPAALLLEEAGLVLKPTNPHSVGSLALHAASSISATTLSSAIPPMLSTRPWSRGRAPLPGSGASLPTCARDCACPLFIVCCGGTGCGGCGSGSGLAVRPAVRRGALVLLERARCCGAAALARSVDTLQLSGSIAQTHIVCARTTAYLAALFADNPRIDTIIAFGAGEKKEEMEAQLRSLGVPPERAAVRAEPWLRAGADQLDRVCAVLASPPGAMAAVHDPVGLACARAGDVALLEAVADAARAAAPPAAHGDERPAFLEEKQMTRDEAQQRRARGALTVDEQRAVLRMAMALPQIQVVVFQTYTLDTGESRDLVTRLVAEANTVARQKRAELAYLMGLRTTANTATTEGESGNAMPVSNAADASPGDLFEVAPLEDNLVPPPEEGCFVTLLKRKEVTTKYRDPGQVVDASEAEASEAGTRSGLKKRRARARGKGRSRLRSVNGSSATTDAEVVASRAARQPGGSAKEGKPIAGAAAGRRGGENRSLPGHSEGSSAGTAGGGSDRKHVVMKKDTFAASTIASRQRQFRRPSQQSATGPSGSSGRTDSAGCGTGNRNQSRPQGEEDTQSRRASARTRRDQRSSERRTAGTEGSAPSGRASVPRDVSLARARRPHRRVLRLPIASIPMLPHTTPLRLPIRIPHRLLLLVI